VLTIAISLPPPSRQMAETRAFNGDDIGSLGLAGNDRPVRDGFVRVAGQPDIALTVCAAYVEPSPAIVCLSFDIKLNAQIAIPYVQPLTAINRRPSIEKATVGHEYDIFSATSV